MSELEQLRRQLARKEKIDKILVDISIRFSRLSDFDVAVEAYLQHIIDLTGYDRAYISVVQDGLMSFSHEVCRAGVRPIKPMVQNVPYEEMQWFKQRQLDHGYCAICSIDEIPEEAVGERDIFTRYRIGACFTKAFVANRMIRGFVNIHHSETVERWDDEVIQLITFGATLMAHVVEQRIVQQELIAAKERAEQSDRLKTAFLANISHEIRTPLNAIVGFSRLINTQSESNHEKNVKFARIIESNSKQLISVISDILDIAKIEAGIVSVSESSFYLTQFLNDIFLQHYESILNRSNLNVQLDVPEGEDLLIVADDMKLKQILDNLIRNAIKFTPQGTITFGYKRIDDSLHFYVKDTGIGIAAENFDLIFERFKQVDGTSTRSYGGNGLGLAICASLVKMLGGAISLESELKRGTTFYFSLPYREGDKDQINNKSNLSFVDFGIEFTGKRFLIVDDADVSRLYLKLLLESAGATCDTAASGLDALEMFASYSKIDAMLLDVQMPDMTGYEVASRIKEINPYLPIVAVTAHAMSGDREAILTKGFKSYIPKPVSRDELFPLLKRVVRN